MAATSLDQVFANFDTASKGRSGWEPLGFLRNPFPTKSAPNWDVFHNQAEVRDRFYGDLGEFLRPPHATQTLLFVGGNRVGKTHFMEHHRQALPARLDRANLVLPIAVVSAESASLEDLFFRIVDQTVDSLRFQTGNGLFDMPARVDTVHPGDLRRALERLEQQPNDARREFQSLLSSWVRGDRLRLAQRRELGVSGLVDTPSQVVNTFGGLVRYLRGCAFGDAGIRSCPGLLVFVDEFELAWQKRRDRRDQFFQGLRALVDECAEDGLFLCIGMATGLGPEVRHLEGEYPALYGRLKGNREIPALVEIESAVVGIEYARAFERHGRDTFLAAQVDAKKLPEPELLTDREIDGLFRNIVGPAPGASVAQADFFDQLHVEAEAKRQRASAAR